MTQILVNEYLDLYNASIDRNDQQPEKGMIIFGSQNSGKTAFAKFLTGKPVSLIPLTSIQKQKIAQAKNSKQRNESDKPQIEITNFKSSNIAIVDGFNLIQNKKPQYLLQLFFVQHALRLFLNNNICLVIIIKYSQANFKYLQSTFLEFLKIWDITSESQLQAILKKINLILSDFDEHNQKIYKKFIEQLKRLSQKQNNVGLIAKTFYNQQKQRIIHFSKNYYQQKQKQDIVSQLVDNMAETTIKIPYIKFQSAQLKKSQLQIFFNKANQLYFQIIDIIQMFFYYCYEPQQEVKTIPKKIQYLRKKLNIDNSFEINDLYIKNFIKYQQEFNLDTHQQSLQNAKSYLAIRQFIFCLSENLNNDGTVRFFKQLQFILYVAQTIVQSILQLVQKQLKNKKVSQIIQKCLKIIQYLRKKTVKAPIDLIQNQQDIPQFFDQWSINIRKKINILVNYDPTQNNYAQGLIIKTSKQLGYLFKNARASLQAVEAYMVSSSYDQVMIAIKQSSKFQKKINKKYLNKLFTRFIYQDQIYYAEKCLQFIQSKIYDEDQMKKFNFMKKKLKNKNKKKLQKNKQLQIQKYYRFHIDQNQALQKLIKHYIAQKLYSQ